MRLIALVLVFIAFTTWSFSIVASQGLAHLGGLLSQDPWAVQLLVDLCISLAVAWTWLREDAKARNIPAWPYIVATLAAGSIGVLAYLIHREVVSRRTAALA